VISTQHSPDIEMEELRSELEKHVIRQVIPAHLYVDTKLHLNPCGSFVVGGPMGDAGWFL
jgi:S-adenosylmethionine synthetase